MPLLTDENRIAELRKQFPTLTHTSWKELSEIEPRPNVDKHHQDMGNIVCATSSDSDFYALRCNERKGMINYSFPYRDADGKINRIFIFEKMKDTYYEHVVSSENFIPIVSEDSEKGVFSGEWVFQPKSESDTPNSPKDPQTLQTIKPISVKVGHKEEVLKRTSACVFTISDMKHFEEKLNDDTFYNKIKNLDTCLEEIAKLVALGILKRENRSGDLRNFLAELSEDGKKVPQNTTSKMGLSVAQQATVLSQRSQNG